MTSAFLNKRLSRSETTMEQPITSKSLTSLSFKSAKSTKKTWILFSTEKSNDCARCKLLRSTICCSGFKEIVMSSYSIGNKTHNVSSNETRTCSMTWSLVICLRQRRPLGSLNLPSDQDLRSQHQTWSLKKVSWIIARLVSDQLMKTRQSAISFPVLAVSWASKIKIINNC